jgi:putative endonuclease
VLAEAVAARALAERGYRVVDRNVRLRGGELDLVCRDADAFVFCEVKARFPAALGGAEEALTAAKLRRLTRLAATYLARVGRREAPYRIELIAVRLNGERRAAAVEVVPVG